MESLFIEITSESQIDLSLVNDDLAADSTPRLLGRLAAKVVEKQCEMAKQRRELEGAVAAALAASRAEIDAEKRRAAELQTQVETLREQLTWKRYRWADGMAKWLHALRGKRS